MNEQQVDIEIRLHSIESSMIRMNETSSRIAQAIERLVVLETQHEETRNAIERTFNAVEKFDKRLSEVEKRLPIVDMVTKGVGAAVVGLLGLIGTAIWSLISKASG